MQSPSHSPQQTRRSESVASSSSTQEEGSSFNFLSSPLVMESHKKLIVIPLEQQEGREEEEHQHHHHHQQHQQQQQQKRPADVVCKVYFKERNEIRRFKLTEISWTAFSEHIGKLFKLDPNELNVRYTDDEGDLITISTDSEFKEVFKLKALNKQKQMEEETDNALKFYIKLKATPFSATTTTGAGVGARADAGAGAYPASVAFIPRGRRGGGREEREDNNDNDSFARRRQKFREKQRRRYEKEDFKSHKKAAKREKKLQHRKKKACRKMIKYNDLHSRFIKHMSIPDNSVLPPGTPFTKTWRVKNEGTVAWPPGTLLRYLSREAGTPFGGAEAVPVGKAVQPGEVIDISVQITAPGKVGTHTGFWRLCTEDGLKFGQRMWCKIQVKEDAPLNVDLEKNNTNIEKEVHEIHDEDEEEEQEGGGGGEEEGGKEEEMNSLLNKLAEMGFKDEDKNREMIKKCGADLENVVAALSEQNHS